VLAAFDWIGLKNELARLTVEKDALHIYASLVVQLLAAILLKKPLSSWAPWLAVLAATLVNEAGDFLLDETEPHIQQWQIDGSIHDLVNTMLLPTLLMLLVRYRPDLFAPRP
jgi:cell shape-determining protein MreD